jgi:hypothetical protein
MKSKRYRLACTLAVAFAAATGSVPGCRQALDIPSAEQREQPSEGGAGGEAAEPCRTTLECVERSPEYDPHVCVSGRCVNLLVPKLCPYAMPQTKELWREALRQGGPEPLILGALLSIPPERFTSSSRNYELSLAELAQTVGGIPTPDGPRPVVMVACKSRNVTVEELDGAVDHLIEDLEVPAMITVLTPADAIRTFDRTARQRQVFMLSAIESEPSLVEVVDDGLLWFMLPGIDSVAVTYGAALDRAVRHLRRIGTLAKDEAVRVAHVVADDYPTTATMADTVERVIRFNDQDVIGNTPDNYLRVSIPSSLLPPEDREVYRPAVERIREFAPHIVISSSTYEFNNVVIDWIETEPGSPRPFYLLSPYQYRAQNLPIMAPDYSGDFHQRVLGINYAAAPDPSAYEASIMRLDEAFPALAGTIRGFENFYDAPYYLGYAAAAVGDRWPLRGPDFTTGMRRLIDGEHAFTVGPDDLASGFAALAAPGSEISLHGTMGAPDWDPAEGTRRSPGSVYCVDVTGAVHPDVLRLDSDGTLVGSVPCFDFEAP